MEPYFAIIALYITAATNLWTGEMFSWIFLSFITITSLKSM